MASINLRIARRSLIMSAALLLAALPARALELAAGVKHITILQLNDVYQLMPVDKGQRGGLARVATLVRQIREKHPDALFLLAGDTLSPSVASQTFKGSQMIAAWNALGLDLATFGNHEFDFGPDVLKQRVSESKFTWVCANAIDKRTGKTVDGVPPYVIRTVDGVKVGVLGLVTPDTLRSSHAGPDIDILDPCTVACKYVPLMKAAGAQVVVGLTHLTMANDQQLCHCAHLDAVVGGHEHYVMEATANGTPIVKAGSDARNLGELVINYVPGTHSVYSSDYQLIPVNAKIADDPKAAAVIAEFEGKLSKSLEEPVGQTKVELDARQADSQTKETNLGDFVADAYREQTGAQLALLNGGSIRSNTVFGPGQLTRRDVLEMLPFQNPVIKLEVSGATLRSALENGVSLIGIKAGGRFPQVSGLHYEFDARRKPGSRIISVTVDGKPLADNQTYTLATNNFVAEGGDGYTMLEHQKELITPEEGDSEAITLMKAIARKKEIAPQVEGRIIRIDSP